MNKIVCPAPNRRYLSNFMLCVRSVPTVLLLLLVVPANSSKKQCINPYERLDVQQNEFWCTPDHTWIFGVDQTGDLSLWHDESVKVWSAATQGDVIARVTENGDLIVEQDGNILWKTENLSPTTIGPALDADSPVSLTINGDYFLRFGHSLWLLRASQELLGKNLSGSTNLHSSKLQPGYLVGGPATQATTIAGTVISNRAVDTASAKNGSSIVDATTLKSKIMAGYQGWFLTADDGGKNEWRHWSMHGKMPQPSTLTIDMWPDMREYASDELTPTDMYYNDGGNSGLYSAYNPKTVERHVKWLRDYSIDGFFVQRFICEAVDMRSVRDRVLDNVRVGAEKYGRVFANMYDISCGKPDTFAEDLKKDWKHLVDSNFTAPGGRYLYHQGRPLVAIWGFGFHNRPSTTTKAKRLIRWFQKDAPRKYRATVMGGIPTGWRTLSRDSKPTEAWGEVYRSLDVISPWSVGRMKADTVNYYRNTYIEPDLNETKSLGIDYMPVVYPGFSWRNMKHNLRRTTHYRLNYIPRFGGEFMWRQLYNAISAGAEMIYVAMFDEVDEGTAIYKVAENAGQLPTTGKFVTLDADGDDSIPSDWYLQLTGQAGAYLKNGGESIPFNLPQEKMRRKGTLAANITNFSLLID